MGKISSSTGALMVRETSNFLVQEYILTSAQNNITFAGLDGLSDGGYELHLHIIPSGAGVAAGLIINGASNYGDYASQMMYQSGASIGGASKSPTNFLAECGTSSGFSENIIDISLFNNQVNWISRGFNRTYTTLTGSYYGLNVPNITSLVIQGYTQNTNTQINGVFAAGTVARLFKKKTGSTSVFPQSTSPLVAEIVVPSTTTSVSFSGLDANLHGGYEIRTAINWLSGSGTIYCDVNGDTNTANYITKEVYFGVGTTPVNPWSGNSNMLLDGLNGAGWYYGITDLEVYAGAGAGWSSSIISAAYWSQTCVKYTPAITNLTSMTLRSSIASSIGAGSRIRIYKKR